MQAQFQAQQMAEKEKRLINMMAARQEETVRRFDKVKPTLYKSLIDITQNLAPQC